MWARVNDRERERGKGGGGWREVEGVGRSRGGAGKRYVAAVRGRQMHVMGTGVGPQVYGV